MPPAVQIEGLRELNKASRAASKATGKEVRQALIEAGAPVRIRAEQLAVSGIDTVGPRWHRMKIGASIRSVYITPATRRAGGSPRPNFGTLLMERAMLPALDERKEEVMREMEQAIDRIADIWERKPNG